MSLDDPIAILYATDRRWRTGLYLMYSPAFFACGFMATSLPSLIIGQKPTQSAADWIFLAGLLVSIPVSLFGALVRAHASRVIARLAQRLRFEDMRVTEGSRFGAWVVLTASRDVLVLERRAMPMIAASIFRSAAVLMWLLITSLVVSQAWIGLPGKSTMASILIAVWISAIATAALWYALSLLANRRLTLDTSARPAMVTLRKQMIWPLPGARSEWIPDQALVVDEYDAIRIKNPHDRGIRLEIGGHHATAELNALALGSEIALRLGLELAEPSEK